MLQVYQKCFALSDNWIDTLNDRKFKYIQREPEEGLNLAARHLSDEHIMEKLVEEAEDKRKSVLFASKQVIIRKNLYYIVAKSIKAGYPIEKVTSDCKLVARILHDIMKSRDNWILFDNMLMALGSLEMDTNAANTVLVHNYDRLFKLIIEYPIPEHKIAVSFDTRINM